MSNQVPVQLPPAQRAHRAQLIRAGTSRARTQTTARSLLLTDRTHAHPRTAAELAAAVRVRQPTIIRTRRRFVVAGREAALTDKPRPGAKPKLTGAVEAHLPLVACRTPPDGKARGTLHRLADQLVDLQRVARSSAVAVLHRLKQPPAHPGA